MSASPRLRYIGWISQHENAADDDGTIVDRFLEPSAERAEEYMRWQTDAPAPVVRSALVEEQEWDQTYGWVTRRYGRIRTGTTTVEWWAR